MINRIPAEQYKLVPGKRWWSELGR